MKERPIIFNGEMVRAILDGRKTMTRRIVKPPPRWEEEPSINHLGEWCGRFQYMRQDPITGEGFGDVDVDIINCPFGVPSDRLWVRETWRPVHINGASMEDGSFYTIQYREGFGVANYRKDWREFYGPLFSKQKKWEKNGTGDLWTKWKSPIHMPLWASRITLEVVSVKVERLQDISEKDAIAEGIEEDLTMGGAGAFGWKDYLVNGGGYLNPVISFKSLWSSIHGPDAWDQNPWVWVVEFKRID